MDSKRTLERVNAEFYQGVPGYTIVYQEPTPVRRGRILVDRRPAWTDVFYCRTRNSDGVFSDRSICTELHCRMYCCWQILTNIHFVTLRNVPFTQVTFTVFGDFVFGTKHNLERTPNYNVREPALQSTPPPPKKTQICNFFL